MKEIIERMLKVEEEARRIQAEAEKRATDVTEECRREAESQSGQIRTDAQAAASSKQEETRRKLDEERRRRLEKTDRENEAYAQTVRRRADAAVAEVVKRVIGG